MPIARTKFGVGLRALLVVVLAGAGLAPVTAAQAQVPNYGAATVAASASPVGTWTATVTVEGVPPFPATFHFTPHNLAFVAGRGSGLWYPTGSSTFTFRVAEALFTTEGIYIGWLDVNQSPTLSGNTFASTGVTTVYDVDDNVTRTANVTITATRS